VRPHEANCQYCEFDLFIDVDASEPKGKSACGEFLSAADMKYVPVIKHDSGWSDLRLRVVGITSLRNIQEGEELLSCYHASVDS
jgi:hypothetical protein